MSDVKDESVPDHSNGKRLVYRVPCDRSNARRCSVRGNAMLPTHGRRTCMNVRRDVVEGLGHAMPRGRRGVRLLSRILVWAIEPDDDDADTEQDAESRTVDPSVPLR